MAVVFIGRNQVNLDKCEVKIREGLFIGLPSPPPHFLFQPQENPAISTKTLKVLLSVHPPEGQKCLWIQWEG